jgi:pimeloyl-ACP methyl ester carboxylesterase
LPTLVAVRDALAARRSVNGRRGACIVTLLALIASVALPIEATPASAAAPLTVGQLTLHRCPDVDLTWCGDIDRRLDAAIPSLGTINIHFEWRPAVNVSIGTIVAVEGGPGYASTLSRDYYIDLFEPLLRDHDLLIVDNRGTGLSGAIDCPGLQSETGDYLKNVGKCGEQLGDAAWAYGTADAADDMGAIIQKLGVAPVDLYGDSYGTYFGQVFSVRHPDLLRSVVLDAAYPVQPDDYLYVEAAPATNHAMAVSCDRSPTCAALPTTPAERLQALLDIVRVTPITGTGHDADGAPYDIVIDAPELIDITRSAAYGYGAYREFDPAVRAFLDHGDAVPLLRMSAELGAGGASDPTEFSDGLYAAVSCIDYPQPFDFTKSRQVRRQELEANLANDQATMPDVFAPFTIDEYRRADWQELDSCLRWPKPPANHHPTSAIEPGTPYPDVPTLVFSGELDSLTSPAEGDQVAARYPSVTHVLVANEFHVSATADRFGCAEAIVRHFVRTLSAGDTSCAATKPDVHMLPTFAMSAADLVPATARAHDHSRHIDRQVAVAAAFSATDAMQRWTNGYSGAGIGLRGGTFTSTGDPVVTLHLDNLRWVDDVRVTGTVRWNRTTGEVVARLAVAGPATQHGDMVIRWNELRPRPTATIGGRIGGRNIVASMPSP